jgi:hypothetical protein
MREAKRSWLNSVWNEFAQLVCLIALRYELQYERTQPVLRVAMAMMTAAAAAAAALGTRR